jgi:hypothetical protein
VSGGESKPDFSGHAITPPARENSAQTPGKAPSAVKQETFQDQPGRPSLAVAEEEDASEDEELPTADLPIGPIRRDEPPATLQAVWETLVRNIKGEKISVAMYLAEGEPIEIKDGVVKVVFAEKFNFHKECLEVPENTKLIERHLSFLLDQPVRFEFQTVKGRPPRETPDASKATPADPLAVPPAENGMLKSAMNIFGGKIIQNP